jgi:hypothetical protein
MAQAQGVQRNSPLGKAPGVEIEAGEPHLAVPRIAGRMREHIDRERLSVAADDRLRL